MQEPTCDKRSDGIRTWTEEPEEFTVVYCVLFSFSSAAIPIVCGMVQFRTNTKARTVAIQRCGLTLYIHILDISFCRIGCAQCTRTTYKHSRIETFLRWSCEASLCGLLHRQNKRCVFLATMNHDFSILFSIKPDDNDLNKRYQHVHALALSLDAWLSSMEREK